jgi:hypothetical protein
MNWNIIVRLLRVVEPLLAGLVIVHNNGRD